MSVKLEALHQESIAEKPPILVVGQPVLDEIYSTPDKYVDVEARQLRFDFGDKAVFAFRGEVFGGNAYNTARNLLTWGNDVTFAWSAGRERDELAERLRLAPGNDELLLPGGWAGRSNILIPADESIHERVVQRLKQGELTLAAKTAILDRLSQTAILHVSSLPDVVFLDEVTAEAAVKGVAVSLSPARAELEYERIQTVLARATTLVLNAEEAAAIRPDVAAEFTSKTSPQEKMRRLALALHDLISSHEGAFVSVTDGMNGSVAVDHDTIATAGLYPETRPLISSLGAGDAATSGIVHDRANNADSTTESALHLANAAATETLYDFGASEHPLDIRKPLLEMPISVEKR